jgi:DNA-binding transcriptional MocR family regulator
MGINMRQFLYQKVVDKIKSLIAEGQLQEDDKLPSIRTLSDDFQVAKITVQNALHKLEAEGLIYAKPKSGYYISAENKQQHVVESNTEIRSPRNIKLPDLFYQLMASSAAFDIKPDDHKHGYQSPHINLLNRNIARAYRHHNHQNSQYYGEPKGLLKLRECLVDSYRRRHYQTSAEQFCITSGCQNSLFIALTTYCQPGDTVAVESPGFYGVLQLLKQLKLNVVELPVSYTQGLQAEQLAQAAAKWQIKACIVTPNYATPTGALMPDSEKRQLVKTAEHLDIVLIEDDIYADLGFHTTPAPLISFESTSPIVLCSSWSKSLSRDMRLGWITSNQDITALVQTKLVNHLADSQNVQIGMAEFIAEGHYQRHLNHYKQQLIKNRQALVATINQDWKFDFRYTLPEGGLVIWLQLPKYIDTLALYNKAIELGIAITPGRLFTNSDEFTNYLRLPFAQPVSVERKKALKQLGKLISQLK